jgi:hypothetical protein
MDFEFTSIAGPGVDLPDRKRTTEFNARSALNFGREFGKRHFVERWRALR